MARLLLASVSFGADTKGVFVPKNTHTKQNLWDYGCGYIFMRGKCPWASLEMLFIFSAVESSNDDKPTVNGLQTEKGAPPIP